MNSQLTHAAHEGRLVPETFRSTMLGGGGGAVAERSFMDRR